MYLREGVEKQPQRVVPLEELQSRLVMKRMKDNTRKLDCQASRLQLLFDLPSHITLRYIIINQSKPKRRKEERTRAKSLRRRKSLIEIKQEVTSRCHVLPSLNKVALPFMSDLKLQRSKLQNTALSSGRTAIESQGAKVVLLMIKIKTKQKNS